MMVEKRLCRVQAKYISSGTLVSGYEIHHGITAAKSACPPLFKVVERNGKKVKYNDGASGNNGRILGTYIHGLFDGPEFRRGFLNRVRAKKGWPALPKATVFSPDAQIDRLASLVRKNIDMDYLYKILNKEGM